MLSDSLQFELSIVVTWGLPEIIAAYGASSRWFMQETSIRRHYILFPWCSICSIVVFKNYCAAWA